MFPKSFFVKKYVAIELFHEHAYEKFSCLLVQKKDDDVVIVDKIITTSIEELKQTKFSEFPVFLIVNNQQVIHKEVEIGETSELKILTKAFPQLRIDDFYYEIVNFRTKIIVSICRKEYLNEQIKAFLKNDITFSGVSLGVCSFSNLMDYVNESFIVTNSHILHLDGSNLIENRTSDIKDVQYSLNGISILSSEIMAFSGVLNFFLKKKEARGSITMLNLKLENDYYQKYFFKKTTRIFVGSLLILLLINFLVFNYYFQKVNTNTVKIETNMALVKKITDAKQRVSNLSQRFKNEINPEKTKSAYIINFLVHELPETISLVELTYQPLEKKIKIDEEIKYQKDLVLISGTCSKNEDFTGWIDKLQNYNLVERVTITSYSKDKNYENVFNLKLNIISDEAKQEK